MGERCERWGWFLLMLLMVWGWSAGAAAQTIASQSESRPFPGVRIVEGRTSSPATDFYAAYVSLCHDYVHVEASGAGPAKTTASWAQSAGVQVAINGDFFKWTDGTSHVYGDAVGEGQRWPSIRTGRDSAYSGEWFYQRYGWIAFGDDRVEFSNTKFVKERHEQFGATEGWRPTSVTTAIPEGTTALVSGFPQLVIEGQPYACGSPTASSCFPDRSDMRQRHPRTAMGLTADRRTFLLVTVDGRSTRSTGMYGTELASLMHQLGAHVAFNLDGGGSSQMWVQGRGTINKPADGSPRTVLNHWGIYAGTGSGQAAVPGSCDQTWDELLHQAHVYETGTTTDVDGDGLPDVCARGPEGVECFLSSGDGLSARVEGPALRDASGWGDPTNYATLRMGDVNGDGLADLCARADAGVRCWVSDGQGFSPAIEGPALSDGEGWDGLKYFSTLRMADIDGDGMDDLCVRGPEGVRCYRSTGGGFGPAIDGPPLGDGSGWGTPRHYGTIRMGDVDGDGRADLCARANRGMRCWLADGTGFGARIDGPAWSDAEGWGDVKYWSTIRLADVDGDGRADLCGRSREGFVCHLSQGDRFGPEIAGPPLTDSAGWGDYSNYSTIRLADVDGDGARDLCARANAGMRCWRWNGAGFDRPLIGGMADDTGWYRERFFRTIQLADVNGDGRADLCARASARFYCWLADDEGFSTRIDGPEWSDASGWSDPKYYATIRIAGPRPVNDGCPGGDCGGEDAGHDAGPVTDAGPDAIGSAPDSGEGPGSDGPGGEPDAGGVGDVAEPGGADDSSGERRNSSTSTSSCACGVAAAPDVAPLWAMLALLGVGVWRRRG